MAYLTRGQAEIYYEVHGSGQTILLTHGFSSTSHMWRCQIDPFAKDHTLILWDMRGHGKTEVPNNLDLFSEEETVADMNALLDHVGAKEAVIAGLSLGGYMSIAFHLAHRARVRGLGLFDTGPGFKSDKGRAAWNETAEARAKKLETNGFGDPAKLGAETRASRHGSVAGLANAARGMLAQKDDRIIFSLPDIKVPTLVVVGADDKNFLIPTDYMAGKIEGSTKHVVPGAGHAVNIDQPEAFNRLFRQFLDSIGETA